MKAILATMAIIGLLAVAGTRSAAGQVPITPAPASLTDTWSHAETYRAVYLTLKADGTYRYGYWSLGWEREETGTYTYADGLLTLIPRQRFAGTQELPGDEKPRVVRVTWISADQLLLQFPGDAREGPSLLLSRG